MYINSILYLLVKDLVFLAFSILKLELNKKDFIYSLIQNNFKICSLLDSLAKYETLHTEWKFYKKLNF